MDHQRVPSDEYTPEQLGPAGRSNVIDAIYQQRACPPTSVPRPVQRTYPCVSAEGSASRCIPDAQRLSALLTMDSRLRLQIHLTGSVV
jgi:hypothetical protein